MDAASAAELRDHINGADDGGGRQVGPVTAGPAGIEIRLTQDLPTPYTLVNGYCLATVLADSAPADPLVLQLRLYGRSNGPPGELARGQIPAYIGLGVYRLPAVFSASVCAGSVWLELFVGNDGEDSTRILTIGWSARLEAGYRF